MSRFQTLTPSRLSREDFVTAFADIYEHSPWVAEQAYDLGQDDSIRRPSPSFSFSPIPSSSAACDTKVTPVEPSARPRTPYIGR